jgi:hypothetical protein
VDKKLAKGREAGIKYSKVSGRQKGAGKKKLPIITKEMRQICM